VAADRASRLTEKERRFAAAIASGMGPTAAYRYVYSNSAGNRAAQANGRQVARRERVAQEIERQRRYPANNFSALQEFAITKLIDMAQGDLNPAVRHKAMTTLLEHADRGLRQPPPPPHTTAARARGDDDRAKIIADLRSLYQKAGIKRTHHAMGPASEECVNDSPNEYNATAEQGDSQLADITIALDGLNGSKSCLAAGDSGAEEPRVGPEAVQPVAASAAEEKCEWVNLPGYFGKARRVRVPIR
jgi:hypothetical protein